MLFHRPGYKKNHHNMADISLLTSTYSYLEPPKNVLNRVLDIASLFELPFVEQLVTEKSLQNGYTSFQLSPILIHKGMIYSMIIAG